MKTRKISVPAKDYRPTKAELEEQVRINRQGIPLDQAVKRLLEPVQVDEVSASDYRKLRKSLH